MYFYDSSFLILIPAMLFSIYAQSNISGTFNRYLRVSSKSGITGADAARAILNRNGLHDIPVEVVRGKLTDHYDPKGRVLRLSEEVYYGNSLASIGVAAHESGHAIQHGEGYSPLAIRNALVPIANIGSNLSWIFVIMGFALRLMGLVNIGILLFSGAVAFQIITLPVEFNASSRALEQIKQNNILYSDEIIGAKRVLRAAAMTYVAATLVAVSQLIRLLLISRERD